jgi:hypothetical protein
MSARADVRLLPPVAGVALQSLGQHQLTARFYTQRVRGL